MKGVRFDLDPVMSTILDQIVLLTQIDRSSISPDKRLESDLGLDPGQVHKVLCQSAEVLGIGFSLENCTIADYTLGEMVVILKSCQLAEVI
jgi:hypothetical protein